MAMVKPNEINAGDVRTHAIWVRVRKICELNWFLYLTAINEL